MNTLKRMMTVAAMTAGIAAAAEVKLEVSGNEWKAVASSYSAASKNGYINSIMVDGKEFLAQEKVPGGSYLCAKEMPALKEIKQDQGNIISGSNALGKIIYTFSDNDIALSYENTSQTDAVYYFIINPDVKTVLVNGTDVKGVPCGGSGSSFKWIQGEAALDFKAESRIWGPWKEKFQVWQLAVPAGKTQAGKIVPGKNAENAKLNQQTENTNQSNAFDYSATGKSGQIPLCMIGDSITWAEKGDCWRKELLERLPNLAFVGTHTAMSGYSHAGEGGNSTGQVLARIKYVPDCPYYNVLIGTNNNGVKTADLIQGKSKQTAEDIIKIVNELLKKKGVEKVFLSSILPCATDNPFRDQCNSATNRILREKFDETFPKDKVVWVEYEKPIRQVRDWEKKIFLHPNEEGYALIGDITANAISSALNVKPGTESVRPANSGVQVVNLMGENNITVCPVIAGWYILSCKVDAVTAQNPEIVLESRLTGKDTFRQAIPVKATQGETISANVFTKYEGYGYTRDFLTLKANGCSISSVLLEKMRPSKKPSIHGKDSYIDAVSPVSKGELLEYSK
ncbi:MAG: GDSL-type esterase/lipase family protein [Victivallales bacterium]